MAMMLYAMSASAQAFQTDTIYTRGHKAVVITPIKHGSLRIATGNTEIQIDPVTQLPPVTDYSAFSKADYILVTHEHFDHLDVKAIEQLRKPETVVIANVASAKKIGRAVAMQNGDVRDYAGIRIEAVPAYNNSADKQQFHTRGRDNGYVLTIDGTRIYIAGDTEDISELNALKDIDVAFLPCNLPYTMTPDQLNRASRMIRPKVLYPYHYGETDMARVKALLKDSGIDVRIRNFR